MVWTWSVECNFNITECHICGFPASRPELERATGRPNFLGWALLTLVHVVFAPALISSVYSACLLVWGVLFHLCFVLTLNSELMFLGTFCL